MAFSPFLAMTFAIPDQSSWLAISERHNQNSVFPCVSVAENLCFWLKKRPPECRWKAKTEFIFQIYLHCVHGLITIVGCVSSMVFCILLWYFFFLILMAINNNKPSSPFSEMRMKEGALVQAWVHSGLFLNDLTKTVNAAKVKPNVIHVVQCQIHSIVTFCIYPSGNCDGQTTHFGSPHYHSLYISMLK